MPDFRINIVAVRYNAQMNQQEWADSLGVDKSTISNWETGKTEPSVTQLRKMSELSGIPMDFIFLTSNPKK